MNRRFITGLLILVCLSLVVDKCYAWPPPPLIISSWKVYAPVGTTANIYAQVVGGGASRRLGVGLARRVL